MGDIKTFTDPPAFDPDWWHYDKLPSGHPYDWSPSQKGDDPWDQLDFHVDLGCGSLKKARLGIDRNFSPGVDLMMDMEYLTWLPAEGIVTPDSNSEAWQATQRSKDTCKDTSGHLPFPDDSIESIISHHMMEHIGPGFLHLMDECHRVLVPGGVLRIISPLFPSKTAVEDPDHKRYFMPETFNCFSGSRDGGHWMESFSVPYTNCRFELPEEPSPNPLCDPLLPPEKQWSQDDVREIRVTLRKWER